MPNRNLRFNNLIDPDSGKQVSIDQLAENQVSAFPPFNPQIDYPVGSVVKEGGSFYRRVRGSGTTVSPVSSNDWMLDNSPLEILNAASIFDIENLKDTENLKQVFQIVNKGVFKKDTRDEPAFMLSGGQLKTSTNIYVEVNGQLLTFGANETITTPTLLVGVDYAIYATADGLIISSNFTFPDGYDAENSRRIGGFHYGNNEYKSYSFYDLNFKPKCKDPRGMVIDISGSSFWADIYLLNTTPDALGTSAYNATIADGASPPKIPAKWGGNGTSQYTNFTQYIATEVLAAYGKRLPNSHEFSVLAQGTTTDHAVGVDPITTKFDPDSRSIIGCEQVSGHLYQFGSEMWDRGDGQTGYGWNVVDTGGRGAVHAIAGLGGVGSVCFGGNWQDAGFTGSRCSYWQIQPWTSLNSISARGVCDHLQQS